MLTLLLKSKDIYKIDAVANRISLALPYEHQMEIDPQVLTRDTDSLITGREQPDYLFPIKFGNKEDVNVEFVIMLDDGLVFKQPHDVAVSTVPRGMCRPSCLKDTDLMRDNPH